MNHKSLTTLIFVALPLLLGGCTISGVRDIAAVTPLPPVSASLSATEAPGEATALPAMAASVDLPPRAATPTPLRVQLPAGEAAAIAFAADAKVKPEITAPLTFDVRPVPITFDEFYEGFNLRKGLALSDKLKSLDGIEVVMEGYMAPPLKPALDWFVLTRVRLEFCPFCSSDADWPTDIALIYLQNDDILATQSPVRVHGQMEIGTAVDPESGMISLVRIYADQIEVIQPQ